MSNLGHPRTTGYIDRAEASFATVSAVTIAPGFARDSTDSFDIEWFTPLAVDFSVAGVGGLDIGLEAADTWYSTFVIADTTGTNAVAGLFSISELVPALPIGYDVKSRVHWTRNDGSSDIRNFIVIGSGKCRTVMWVTDTATRVILSGGSATVPTAIDASAFMPPTSRFGHFAVEQTGTPTVSFFLTAAGVAIATLTKQQAIAGPLPVDASQQIFYSNSSPAGNVDVNQRGYVDTL